MSRRIGFSSSIVLVVIRGNSQDWDGHEIGDGPCACQESHREEKLVDPDFSEWEVKIVSKSIFIQVNFESAVLAYWLAEPLNDDVVINAYGVDDIVVDPGNGA